MNEFGDELGPRDVEALHDLPREKTPPAFLEQRVVGALREAQLIRSPWFGRRRQLVLAGLSVAASAVLFTVGFVIGAWWKSPSIQIRPEFVLLLRNSPRELPIRDQQDHTDRVREYSLWARNMIREGSVLDGEDLSDDGRILNLIDGQRVTSEITPDEKNTAVAGYFLIKASDYQQALSIAESCPHLKYGGVVEVRKIQR